MNIFMSMSRVQKHTTLPSYHQSPCKRMSFDTTRHAVGAVLLGQEQDVDLVVAVRILWRDFDQHAAGARRSRGIRGKHVSKHQDESAMTWIVVNGETQTAKGPCGRLCW